MSTWVWFVVVPIWAVSGGLLVSTVGLMVKAYRQKKVGGFSSAFDTYDRIITRNLTAAGLNVLTVFIMLLSR